MEEIKIGEVLSFPKERESLDQAKMSDPLSDFKKLLHHSVKEINALSEEANQSVQEMALGKLDIHEAMIAMEKANISFRLMLQVRNKLISAYEEIMRMPL